MTTQIWPRPKNLDLRYRSLLKHGNISLAMNEDLLSEVRFFKNSGRPDSVLSGRCKLELLEAKQVSPDWFLFLLSQSFT